jgi:NAD(P)-dependent dehydrogenase (short-subunit alcohol dehydrogenase family)
MAAVEMEASALSSLLKGIEGVVIANINSPKQTVISGEKSGVLKAVELLKSKDINAKQIPVSAAFHSPIVEPAKKMFSDYLKKIRFSSPKVEVFSNTYAAPYDRTSQKIKQCLSEHMVKPVKFANEIEEMYKEGARIFIEVGPGSILTHLTQQILSERITVVSTDIKGQEGLTHLLKTLGKLAVLGLPLSFERFYEGRSLRMLDLNSLGSDIADKQSPTTWLVNGSNIIHPNRKHRKQNQRNGKITLEAYKLRDRRLSREQKKDEDLEITEFSSESDERSAAQMKRHSDVTSSTNQARKRDETSPPRVPELNEEPISESHMSPDNVDAVMVQYQKLMNKFLETQKNIMLAYLQGTSEPVDQDFARESNLPQTQTQKVPVEKDNVDHTPAEQPVEQVHPSQGDSEENGIETERVKEELLRVTSEHTGYPQEMMNPDLDMEADLGIDSIKRVEILNAFTKCFNGNPRETVKGIVENLSRLKTLRAVWEKTSKALMSENGQEHGLEVKHKREDGAGFTDNEFVPRYLLVPHVIPIAKVTLHVPKEGVFIITDDGRGLSVALAQELRGLGGRAVILRTDSDLSETDSHTYTVDLTDFSQIKKVLDVIEQEYHSVAGIIHLLPLAYTPPFREIDLQAWRRYLKRDVKSLFSLARLLGPKIRDAGRRGAGWIVAATNLNSFSNGRSFNNNGFVGQAGIAGLLKTLSLEWQEVRCKAIDLDMSNNTSVLTEQLLREMAVEDDHVELTYRGTERIMYKAKPAPLNRNTRGAVHIKSDWVVLITGGAAGITSKIAYELAMKYQPTLLLVGRSPFPEEDEPPDMAALTSPKEVKAKLIERLQSSVKSITPAMVELAYAKFMKSREIRHNLRNLRQAGATVHYYQSDVRDEQQFGHLIDEMYRTHGKIDGVIHGAGIIEDKLLEDKNPDSFDRVFDTKTDSAFILTRKIQPASLKFMAFFTSVAGCFGNRGQSDYAAANEVLNKLAVYLDDKYHGRVVAINWGPWKKLGMVSPELEKKFNELGIQLILPSVGPDLFDQEITWGDKGKVEIVIGDGPWKT